MHHILKYCRISRDWNLWYFDLLERCQLEISMEVSWVSVHMGIKVSWAHKWSKRTGALSGSRVLVCSLALELCLVALAEVKDWARRAENDLFSSRFRVPHVWHCSSPPNQLLRLPGGVRVPHNLCHEAKGAVQFSAGGELQEGGNLTPVWPLHSTTPVILSFSKPHFPFLLSFPG